MSEAYNVIYYDQSFDKLMSYNAFLNIIVGTRGVGKLSQLFLI